MLTGTDLRRYRRAIGLNQEQLAERLGVSQSTLSLLEGGRIPLADSYLDKLNEQFNRASVKVKFADYVRRVEEERREGLALVGNAAVSYATIPVWRWEPNFDLGSPASALTPQAWITVRAPSDEVIAFRMPKGSAWWADGEILAFLRTEPARAPTGALALVQLAIPKVRVPHTTLVLVRWVGPTSQRVLQFEPAEKPEGLFTPAIDQVEGFLKCFFRARYLDE
jgi:transcriptional regulator with XRE-family HTH domain